MITDLWIENFKGIGKRQHIPLRPITLLFGTNSSGKSTVLHALLYLREVLCHGNCDPTHSLAGESTISLGGFDSCLHKGSDCRSEFIRITLRFESSTTQRTEFTKWAMENAGVAEEERKDASREIEDPLWLSDSSLSSSKDTKAGRIRFLANSPEVIELSITVSKVYRSDETDETPLAPAYVESAPTVTRFELSVDGIDFIDINASQDETLSPWGMVNLLSPVWGQAVNGYSQRLDIMTEDSGDQFQWRQNLLALHAIHRSFQENVASAGSEAIDSPGRITVYSGLLEVLKWKDYEVAQTSRFPEVVKAIRLKDYFSVIRPIELDDTELGYLNEPDDSAIAVILTADEESSNSEQGDELRRLSRLVAIVAPNTNAHHQLVLDAVNRIRSYLFSPGYADTPERGPWTCAFEIPSIESALPERTRQFRPKFDREYLKVPKDVRASERFQTIERLTSIPPKFPEPRYPGDPGDEQRFVAATVDSVVRGSLRWVTESLEQVTYVGPKRATVPRSLASTNADDFREWGNGLGAWNWLLKCSSADLLGVNEILSDDQWLRSGYKLDRRALAEVQTNDDIFLPIPPMLFGHPPYESTVPLDAYEELLKAYHELRKTVSEVTRIVLVQKGRSNNLYPQDVGEGITQVIPIIAAIYRNSRDDNFAGSFVAVEQPELHLHPSMAARLGDVLVDAIYAPPAFTKVGEHATEPFSLSSLPPLVAQPRVKNGFMALVETHSEHIILRILRRIRQATDDDLPRHIPPVKPDDVCVLWVDNLGDGTTYTRLRINGAGEFIDRWPEGFFREREEDLFG